jgi:signal transduction histidine kinase
MSQRFWTQAIIAFATVVVLLSSAMIIVVGRMDALSAEQVHHIRAAEEKITLAERLRWSGEVVVSDGRGFLISGHADVLTALRQATKGFDRALHELKRNPLTPDGRAIIADVESRAKAFRAVQEELVLARRSSENVTEVVRRFDAELLPLRREFGRSLDRLVETKLAAIRQMYGEAQEGRARLASWLRALIAGFVMFAFALSWLFARALARSFAKEHDALEAARRALIARDTVLGVVAHDLRTPLGAIMMKADRIAKAAESEEVRKRGASIVNVAARMEHLIKTMLDVATLEAGRLTVSPKECSAEELLLGATEVFGSLAAAKRVTLEQHVEQPHLAVLADRERVLQVLSNLMTNALKFTPQDGKITMSVHSLGDTVRFSVADTGAGIAREHLASLFDRFWKHETLGNKGTGLGLFIAKGIVIAHGGRMWVESEPGRGATFFFTLPAATAQPIIAQAQPA